MKSGYASCTKSASVRGDWEAYERCDQSWLEPHKLGLGRHGWSEWWQLVVATAIGMVLIYLIIAAGVFIGKWVLRGRNS
jgi:hypothetical protein